MIAKQLFTSATDQWCTPAGILERVYRVLGEVDLDPAADMSGNVTAKTYFTVDDDGLRHPWAKKIYLNPPYGKTIGLWASKFAREYRAGRMVEAMALMPRGSKRGGLKYYLTWTPRSLFYVAGCAFPARRWTHHFPLLCFTSAGTRTDSPKSSGPWPRFGCAPRRYDWEGRYDEANSIIPGTK